MNDAISMTLTDENQLDLIEALLLAMNMTDQILKANFSQDCLNDGGALLEPSVKKVFDQHMAQKARFASLRSQLIETCPREFAQQTYERETDAEFFERLGKLETRVTAIEGRFKGEGDSLPWR